MVLSVDFRKNSFSIVLSVNIYSDIGPTSNYIKAIKIEEIPPTSPKISKIP